jgi:magnesium chelatase subunit D
MIKAGISDASWVAGILALCGPELGGAAVAENVAVSLCQAIEAVGKSMLVKPLPASVPLEALTGSLDLAATLALGKPVWLPGHLQSEEPQALLVRRAEKLDRSCVAALAGALDNQSVVLLAATQGVSDDDGLSPVLLDRLAFYVADNAAAVWSARNIASATALLPRIEISDHHQTEIVSAALLLGINSVRSACQAVRTSRAIAALSGDAAVSEDHVLLATRLVLAHRATQIPQEEEQEAQNPAPESQTESQATEQGKSPDLSERVVEAIKASLPKDVLSELSSGQGHKAAGRSRQDALRSKAKCQRGRRLGHKRCTSLARERLDVLATLRTAAPWQPVRRRLAQADRMIMTRDDFRVARIKQRNEATAIFAVDASGSTAFQRLAEAKGAVESVLAECYVRRDKAALISFRSKKAEVLLPPTRSLERARRALSALPGGGGTPLASALDQVLLLAHQVRRTGSSPLVIVLTDGRANVTREGEGNKVKAMEQAEQAARVFASDHIEAMVIDVSPEPQKHARALAVNMGARYLPMPRARAAEIARPVQQAMQMATR